MRMFGSYSLALSFPASLLVESTQMSWQKAPEEHSCTLTHLQGSSGLHRTLTHAAVHSQGQLFSHQGQGSSSSNVSNELATFIVAFREGYKNQCDQCPQPSVAV